MAIETDATNDSEEAIRVAVRKALEAVSIAPDPATVETFIEALGESGFVVLPDDEEMFKEVG